jgi:hypothetical protein
VSRSSPAKPDTGFKDRHRIGAGAAACAVCCAAPILGLLGIAGAGVAATVATFLFAGAVFAIVVGVLALAATLTRRHRSRQPTCDPTSDAAHGPVDVEFTPTRSTDGP